MTGGDIRLWGLRSGRSGKADGLFLANGRIALGRQLVGDLRRLQATRSAFKIAVTAAYPEMSSAAVPGAAGQLYRFLYEIRPGDYVAYPSPVDGLIHLGKVQDNYSYNPDLRSGFPHQRRTDWLVAITRESLSQQAIYELGVPQSLFRITRHSSEFFAHLKGELSPRSQ